MTKKPHVEPKPTPHQRPHKPSGRPTTIVEGMKELVGPEIGNPLPSTCAACGNPKHKVCLVCGN